jgi:hypothetical protein
MNFPQYRKLEGFQRFYKILDERTFVELAFVNGKPVQSCVEAKQYPEMLRIQDMLNCEWSFREMKEEETAHYFSDL